MPLPADSFPTPEPDAAPADLVAAVYDQLHSLAQRFLQTERPDHTLQPTALVHEAYLRLAGSEVVRFRDRAHFVALASRTIRRILIDHARSHRASEHKIDEWKVQLHAGVTKATEEVYDLLGLDEALAQLAQQDPRKSRLVELRFFGGLTVEEAAGVLGISRRAAADDWVIARAWLRRELSRGLPEDER